MACVIHAAYIDGDADIMFLPTSLASSPVVTRANLKSAFELATTFVDLIFSFSARFSAFRLSQEETALFCALMLISPGITLSSSLIVLNIGNIQDQMFKAWFHPFFTRSPLC